MKSSGCVKTLGGKSWNWTYNCMFFQAIFSTKLPAFCGLYELSCNTLRWFITFEALKLGLHASHVTAFTQTSMSFYLFLKAEKQTCVVMTIYYVNSMAPIQSTQNVHTFHLVL